MKRLILAVSIFALAASIPSETLWAQDTFSIVALDTVTGEVGSAGASCIESSIIISDVLPGIGAVHTQAQWNSDNQLYANQLLADGNAPSAIIDSLRAKDAQGNPHIRQYGIVALQGPQHAAGYTGDSCLDYKGHIVGPYYSIQGNILLGHQVIADMETHFLAATGTLADKLMAALQGAKRAGADTRCLADGTSSKSSFIRVAKSTDNAVYALDIVVRSVPKGIEPIDTLQTLYSKWKSAASVFDAPSAAPGVSIVPNPMSRSTTVTVTGLPQIGIATMVLYAMDGKRVRTIILEGNGEYHDRSFACTATAERGDLPSGVYVYRIYSTRKEAVASGEIVIE